jgi:AcrR family transcriptional regulator
MVRVIPAARFGQLIEVATQTFIRRGYRQTQMAEIAQTLGFAKGTLYGYVESKDALFDAAIRFADRRDDVPAPNLLPVRTPKPGATVRYVRQRVSAEASDTALVRMVQGALAIDNAAQELKVILEDLYLRLARNRYAIKLVDRCAADYPDLAAAWFGEGRWAQHQQLVYLIQKRVAAGSYRACENVDVVARTLLETITFWALHRHFDPSAQEVDDADARRVVIDLLSRGLLQVRS